MRPTRDARAMRRLALMLAFASGLTSLGYQVVWNRLVGAGTGSSTYVFTIILTLFLTGIAIGAALSGRLRLRVRPTTVLIAFAQLLTAVLVVAGAYLLNSPPWPLSASGAKVLLNLGIFTLTTALVVLPATIAMGITFPVTAALLDDADGQAGKSSGRLLAVNTAGSLVATFVLPFFIIPLIGSPATLAVLAGVNASIGLWLLVRERDLSSTRRWSGAVAGVAVVVLILATAATGIAFGNPTTEILERAGVEIHESTEDEIASVVAATRRDGTASIWVAGTGMTVLTVDTKLMPLIPLALRPDAERGLTIAFGMGTAFRTSLLAGVTTDAVELVPSVPRMLRWFYPDAEAVLADPNGQVIIADGRNHVELADQLYDFIVVDPPPPPEASGVSVISTLEFYQAAKKRLTPEGVMVQWVPFGQTQDEFLAHVRSFLAAFPNVNVIAGPGGNGFNLIGSDGPVDLDPPAMEAVLARPGILEDLNEAPDSQGRSASAWASVLQDLTWASNDELRAIVGDGPLITDDRPLPEYFILRRLADPLAKELSVDGLRELTGGP